MEVAREIERDGELLEAAENGYGPRFRTWTCRRHAVVLGRSLDVTSEVNLDFCRSRGIPVLRRPSGGGAVVVGPGTLQYAFALPYYLSPELSSIDGAKTFCNRLLLAGLEGMDGIAHLPCGDLVRGQRKIGGLALRRRRGAVLLHGTILVDEDLELIARALRHPSSEPPYRRGRSHAEFLANLGSIDGGALEQRVAEGLSAGHAPATPRQGAGNFDDASIGVLRDARPERV